MSDLEKQLNASQAEAQAEPMKMTPELLKQLGEFRQRLHASVAQIVMAMMVTPRYKHCSLADIEQLVLNPLLRDRIAVAHAKLKEGEADLQDGPIAGIAIWAKVSPEVDAKVREQIKAKIFPIRLKAEDWASGDIAWLLDVIAPNPKLATAVIANLRQVVKEGELRVHPALRELVIGLAGNAEPSNESANAGPVTEKE